MSIYFFSVKLKIRCIFELHLEHKWLRKTCWLQSGEGNGVIYSDMANADL